MDDDRIDQSVGAIEEGFSNEMIFERARQLLECEHALPCILIGFMRDVSIPAKSFPSLLLVTFSSI